MDIFDKEKFSIYEILANVLSDPLVTFEKIFLFLESKGYFNLHNLYLQFVDDSLAGGLLYYNNIILYAFLATFFILWYGKKRRRELLFTINPVNSFKYNSFKVDVSFLFFNALKIDALVFNLIVAVFLLRKVPVILNQVDFYENPISQALFYYMQTLNPATATIIIITLAFIVYDFGGFFTHYLMHRCDFLWVFHKVHHYPEQITWISSIRAHPVDVVLMWLIPGTLAGLFLCIINGHPMIMQSPDHLLPNNSIVYLVVIYIPRLLSFFNHSKLPIFYGKYLGCIFISPSDHMIHHAKELKGQNFGGTFAFWDILFKTKFSVNSYDEYIKFANKLGVDHADDNLYKNLFQAIIYPFKEFFLLLQSKFSLNYLKKIKS